MKHLYLTILIILAFKLIAISQINQKQANTTGSEICIDAPYHMQKFDSLGNLNVLPIHVFVHGSSCLGCNNELMNIVIKIKNAEDDEFNDTIFFNEMSEEDFLNLFINKSYSDADIGIQSFDESLPVSSSEYSIDFTSDSHSIPYTTYTDIVLDYWWFTIVIPADKLVGYSDVIDLEVSCELDWDPDYSSSMRVFRQTHNYPVISDWYRGDVHYHGMFTQNDAEVGLPLDATKYMAKVCGIDWISVTDHSCDFDNYGVDMYSNWDELGSIISNLNDEDTSFLFIRAIEMTVKNSANDHIHALTYPRVGNPLNMPYFGDGDGDMFATNVNVDNLCDSLVLYNCFTYAAHPFAEGDELSFAVDGSVWNLGHDEFPVNGNAHEFYGEIICNDLSSSSDIFSDETGKLIKDGIVGGQIWNLYSSLITNEAENPWDVNYEGGDAFTDFPFDDDLHTRNRLMQNFEVTEFIWKTGLLEKNLNESLENWKYFISAGSDAHGSFNYSNTDLFMGISGQVTDNAIGKLSTLAYCPDGMGNNGRNVLKALKNGRIILSSGPVIGFNIDTDNTNDFAEILLGSDTILNLVYCGDATFTCFSANSEEYGNIIRKQILIKTETDDYIYDLDNDVDLYEVALLDLLNEIFSTQADFLDQWFLIRAELETSLTGLNTDIYKTDSKSFYSYSNPVWLKINSETANNLPDIISFGLFPNPTEGNFKIVLNEVYDAEISILDVGGRCVKEFETDSNLIYSIQLPAGVYFIKLKTMNYSTTKKIVVY